MPNEEPSLHRSCSECRREEAFCDLQRPCDRCKTAGLEACVSEDEGNDVIEDAGNDGIEDADSDDSEDEGSEYEGSDDSADGRTDEE